MRRVLGITIGIATHAVFFATVPPLYCFLRNDFSGARTGSLWVDAFAALQFGVLHSLLLWPGARRFIGQWIGAAFYGCFFSIATCASLWLLFGWWRGSSIVVFAWPEALQPLVRAGFVAAWGALVYSLSLTGLGYQTGFTPWWKWVRREPLPRREFRPRGAYRWFRHPVYLSFLGLVWLTPIVTADRAILIGVWTAYILIGSHLKDERLAAYLGDAYREYLATVPGYPLVRWGPLGTRRNQLPPLRIYPLPNADDEPGRKAA
jgi:protein-S-isoprenylcysteine O-methyltransferase Ste14